VCARYYRDAAEKLPILEISRLFRRMAQENEARKGLLEES
jgi:histone H3/H4